MSSLKILSVYDRLYLRKAKFMFKVFNKSTPEYISENFILRNDVNTTVNLRSSACCFVPPKPRTEYFKHSIRYSGCLIWNSLSEKIKNASSINSFHNQYADNTDTVPYLSQHVASLSAGIYTSRRINIVTSVVFSKDQTCS